jgi:hypothetical protein
LIFSYFFLNVLKVLDLCSLGSCSQFWRDSCGSDSIWESLTKQRWPSLHSSSFDPNTKVWPFSFLTAAISVKVKQTQFYFFTLAVLFNLISEFCNFNPLILLFIVIRVEMNQTLLLLFSFKLCYWMLPMNVLFESVSDSC